MLKNTDWIKLQSEMGGTAYKYSIIEREEGERGGLGKLSAASVPEAAGLGFQDQQAVVMVTSRNSSVFRETEQVLILCFLLLSPIGQSSELTPSLNW